MGSNRHSGDGGGQHTKIAGMKRTGKKGGIRKTEREKRQANMAI